MPTYCYETKAGRVYDRVYPFGRAPRKIVVRGRIASRSYAAEQKSVPSAVGWPLECIASGVNANQAGELRGYLARAGVPTEVSRDGNPIYRNAQHRRKALKARGLVDRSSYL